MIEKEGPLNKEEQGLVSTITAWADLMYSDNVKKGFHDRPKAVNEAIDQLAGLGFAGLATRLADATKKNRIEMSGLVVSEIAEAIEATRTDAKDDHLPQFDGDIVEAADAIIRLMDYAASHGKARILGEALIAKMRYNRTRPFMHGKKC